jgi:hypothetical protein
MAERTDLTVEWTRSPRIITVAAPSVALTMQDLVDSCKGVLEQSWAGLDQPALHSSGGKQDLGGGVAVGITVTLQNAQIAFETRNISISSGTATSDQSGTVLTDLAATFITDGVSVGDAVLNFADRSSATVIAVLSQTQLSTYQLRDGTANTWHTGDVYKIYQIAQCSISGGNLVAVDSNGTSINPVTPTAFTQVQLANSSSATLQTLDGATIAEAVWDEPMTGHTAAGTAGEMLGLLQQTAAGRWRIIANQMIFYADDGITPILTFDLKDEAGNPSMANVFERVPA